jgi:uncharacterized protein with HEPN domain
MPNRPDAGCRCGYIQLTCFRGDLASAESLQRSAKAWHPALMTGMRHRIVHGYYQVGPMIVWDTCQNDLGPLIQPLQTLLQQNP